MNKDLPFSLRDIEKNSSFSLLTSARSAKPLRITRPIVTTHPVLRGNKNYLRTLRAAEMAAWEAASKV